MISFPFLKRNFYIKKENKKLNALKMLIILSKIGIKLKILITC